MALPSVTVAFDLHNYFGEDFDPAGAKATATTNVPNDTIHDTSTGETRLGGGRATVATDGTGAFTHWAPGADGNPTSWQTTYHFDVRDPALNGQRLVESFGPFTVTGTSKTVANKALTSNVATITTTTAHGLVVGNSVTVAGVDATFNGTYTITGVPSSTTFSYAKTATNVASVASGGTVTSPHVQLTSLEEEQAVPPTYLTTVTAALQGYVAQAQEYAEAASALVVISGGVDTLPASPFAGQLLGRTYTEETTIETTIVPVTLAAGDYVWRWTGIKWDYRIIDGWTSTVETTLPTAGTLTVIAAETTAALDVDGAMDATGLHATPYSFRISDDDGATWSAYTAWQAGETYNYTGLTSSTAYSFQHRVRDVFGNVREGLAVDTTTAPIYTWADLSTWAFTGTDGTDLNGLAPTTGTGTMVAPASNSGATPPILVNISGNKGHVRAAGSAQLIKLTQGTAHDGIGLEFDATLHSSASMQLLVDTNGSFTNYVGFAISSAGAVTAFDAAAGTPVYTAEPGAPTVVPDTAHIKALFTKNNDGSCTGKLYVDGVLYGSLLAAGWTWQGKIVGIPIVSNQQDSYIDNLKVLGGTAV